ncbi:hypothetical protein GPECTOR_26g518 [Gonium pectorale]|uniref:Sugar phosphate phosphatase n=1 Tax=Gonium pectorale TaxID=33097 RepID=A0A150GG87_GONPE|nr:hypothetical protein GPECTOR_26g518 [Gonium pectorale]|eukprot:KXZ48615.1 hypothetical protein GPECTOR_26g518 [Gonium pectorale]
MIQDVEAETARLVGAAAANDGLGGEALLDAANAAVELAAARQPAPASRTWLGLPWLTVECYIPCNSSVFAPPSAQRHPSLAGLDPFRRQKDAAWGKSAGAAADMAAEVQMLLRALHSPADHVRAADGQQGPHQQPTGGIDAASATAAARLAVLAGLRIALWGNKADLSLLAGAAGLEEHHLAAPPEVAAAVGASTAAADAADASTVAVPASHIIVDEGEAVWEAMASLRARRAASVGDRGDGDGNGDGDGVRVDIVLDNSGLELFADLCLADLLLEAGVADRVVLHGKAIPWFVSDTLRGDLEGLLGSCEASQPPGGQVPAAAWEPVRALAARWRRHLAPTSAGGTGAWSWAAHSFWTTPAPFAWMSELAPELYNDLSGSDLVIFKGDLNYRKLTHDCRWPHTTPFVESLQGFRPAPLVALRTLKADVAVGLAPGLDSALDAADADWLVDGKWGMVQAAL